MKAVKEMGHAHSIPKIRRSSLLEGIGDGLFHETSVKGTALYIDKNWRRIHKIRECDRKS